MSPVARPDQSDAFGGFDQRAGFASGGGFDLHLILVAGDHVVIGLLGDVFLVGEKRPVFAEVVSIELCLCDEFARFARLQIVTRERAHRSHPPQIVPGEKWLFGRVVDDRGFGLGFEAFVRLLAPFRRAQRDHQLVARRRPEQLRVSRSHCRFRQFDGLQLPARALPDHRHEQIPIEQQHRQPAGIRRPFQLAYLTLLGE